VPRDAALDRAAREFAAAVAGGTASPKGGEQATRRAAELAGGRFAELDSLVATLPEVGWLPESALIESPRLRAIGIGVTVAEAKDLGPHALYVTLVLGLAR
jgi:hypothetical protein